MRGPVPLHPAQQAPHPHHDERPLGRHRESRQGAVCGGEQQGDNNGTAQPEQAAQPPAEYGHQGNVLARDGDDVGQAAAAKQRPLLIRDALLLAEGECRQQGRLTQAPPAGVGLGQPALAPARGHGLYRNDPAQVAGRRDPLAKQQAPPVQPRLVGEPVGGLEGAHQGDEAAGRHGRQRLVGVEANEGFRAEGPVVQGRDPQQQADKFITLRLRTLHPCGYDVAGLHLQPLQPGQPILQVALHPEHAEQQKQQPPMTAIGERDGEGQQHASPCHRG
ncbi:hypothetical protein D3C76_991380 [compost metagenome]